MMKEFAGPLATIIAAMAAVAITVYFSRQSVAISKEQLRQARFDRRLEVYLSAADFYDQLIKWEGSEEQQKARHRFFVALHASYFLFDGDGTIETVLSTSTIHRSLSSDTRSTSVRCERVRNSPCSSLTKPKTIFSGIFLRSWRC